MSKYKVTMVSATINNVREFHTDNAESKLQAAFLAGVDYAADLVILAHTLGALEALLPLTGAAKAVEALVQVAEEETIEIVER